MICAMGTPHKKEGKSFPVWIYELRADAEKAAREIRSHGERYRIYPRQISAGGQSVVVWVLVITGRREEMKK